MTDDKQILIYYFWSDFQNSSITLWHHL